MVAGRQSRPADSLSARKQNRSRLAAQRAPEASQAREYGALGGRERPSPASYAWCLRREQDPTIAATNSTILAAKDPAPAPITSAGDANGSSS